MRTGCELGQYPTQARFSQESPEGGVVLGVAPQMRAHVIQLLPPVTCTQRQVTPVTPHQGPEWWDLPLPGLTALSGACRSRGPGCRSCSFCCFL